MPFLFFGRSLITPATLSFSHARYPQFQSMPVLVIVSAAFAQILPGLHGDLSQRVGERGPLVWGGGCGSASVLQAWWVNINCCFSAFHPDDWALPPVGLGELTTIPGRNVQETCCMNSLQELTTPSPLQLLLQGALAAVRRRFCIPLYSYHIHFCNPSDLPKF